MTISSPVKLADLDPNRLFLLPLGVGSAFTRIRFHTSVLLIAGGRVVLVDAPAPLRRVMYEAEKKADLHIDANVVDALFLTHLHGDHCNGVEELGFFRRFNPALSRPALHIHESLVAPLWHRLEHAMSIEGDHSGLDGYFDIRTFNDGDQMDLGIPGFVLEPIRTNHFITCHGFKASYQGASIGYSSDTTFLPGLIDFFKDCDLILHDCGPGAGHTDPAALLALPEEIRRKIRVMHLVDEFDQASYPIEALEEGKLYSIEGSGQRA
ncbi:MAG: ribonuclease Z [Candidatus Sumerlaeia bacterium]|nr:ribonuclease Z [Candidatus Sumerlaeia bacterium]